MSRVFWDTNLFIYLLEGFGSQSHRVAMLRERMQERADELCTSTLTLGEVLVKPAEQGNQALRERYADVLSRTARLIAFDRDAARLYAEIRRNRAIRPPDAIQLACAAHAGVDLFITNDDRPAGSPSPASSFSFPWNGRSYDGSRQHGPPRRPPPLLPVQPLRNVGIADRSS